MSRESPKTMNVQSHSPSPDSRRIRANRKIAYRHREAFTLLEIVASLVMMAVVAAMLAPLWVSGLRTTVEGSQRIDATHALRSEMESWIREVRTIHANSFEDLPALAASHFSGNEIATLSESVWVTFENDSPGQYQETLSADPTNHCRITLQDARGIEFTYIFSRPPESSSP